MPQGSWLGPLSFIALIDDLKLSCPTHKFVDDTTITEILAASQPSLMHLYFQQLVDWTLTNSMQINENKTKEMVITTSHAVSIPPFPSIGRVSSFKILGVIVSNNLKWTEHVHYISAKANSRLHFLKQLKRAGLSNDDILHFYLAVIRPVLEYAAPVWHSGLTNELSDQLESLQKRALRIIFGYSRVTDISYDNFCAELGITSTSFRRDEISCKFFHNLFDTSSCLHHLIPAKRDVTQSQKLRHPTLYQAPFARTERFKNSFIIYGLNNYM